MRESKAIEEKSTQSKLDGMRAEIGELTAELHQRHVAMATLHEQMASVEKRVRAEQETVDRKSAELQVTVAQLDALRLENRHLRRNLGDRSASIHPRDDGSSHGLRGEDESALAQIRDAYNKSMEALQVLKHTMTSLPLSLLELHPTSCCCCCRWRTNASKRK